MDRKRKILHIAVSLAPEWGGPTKVVCELTEALAKKGIDVSLFAPVQKGDEAKIIRPKGVNLKLFEQSFFAHWWSGYSPGLSKSVVPEVRKFDLVHIHELWSYPHLYAYRAAKKAKKPYVVTIHGGLAPWAINHKRLKKHIYSTLIQRRILKEAAALHAITDEEIKQIRAFGLNNKIEMIPNGINIEEFQFLPARQELERFYPQLIGKQILLFLGRLHPIKGLDILARAFGKVANKRDDLCLLLVGSYSNGYQAEVVKVLASEGVLDKVVFTGMLTGHEKLAALGGADFLVQPSYSEGFSMTVLEAMAAMLPVIITRQCNFPEVATVGAGLVIEPEVGQLEAAIKKLLSDLHLQKEMGSNGRRLVSEKFTWDIIADQMCGLYEVALGDLR